MTATHVNGVSFYRDDDTSVAWEDFSGERPLPAPGGGTRDAALLIQLGVDGQHTTVHGQYADRAGIAKAIADLTYLLEHLDAMYPAAQPRGRCLEHGDWGRCSGHDGHDGAHKFPTEADWNAMGGAA